MRRLALAALSIILVGACSLTPLDDLAKDASTDSPAPIDAPADLVAKDVVPIDAGSPYADKVMADAPLAYWRLDETTGTVAHDASGNHHDCNFVGAVSFGTAGALVNDANTATTFDGNTGHVDCGQLFDFAGASPFTIEMWLHPVVDGTYRGVFGKNALDVDSGLSGTGMHGYISSLQPDAGDNHLTFERLVSAQTKESAYAQGIPTTTWMHMVAIYDGSNVRLYVNAALGGSAASASSLASTADPFVFAGANAYTPFNGAIDEVAIYASALPPNRILAHYNAGIGL
jgi:hypothetical protein